MIRNPITRRFAVALCPLVMAIPEIAWGQDMASARASEMPGGEKSRDSRGLDIAGFRVKLAIDTDVFMDDNIYAKTDETVGDTYLKAAPKLTINKDTSRFKLTTGATITRFQYARQTKENRWDWLGNAGIEMEPLRETFLRARGSYAHSHEDRGDPNNDASSVAPTPYDLLQSEFSLNRELGRLKANIEGSYFRYDYEDTLQNNGGMINNQDRDRAMATLKARATFRFSPGYSAVFRGEWNRIDYRLPVNDFGVNRDSSGWRMSGGVYFSLTNVLDGEVFAGYLRRRYSSPELTGFGAPFYGAALIWSASRTTKVRVSADRRVEETTMANTKNYVLTTLEVAADREFTRDLSLTATARRGQNDFLALDATNLSAPNRRDTLYSFDLSTKYKFGRNFIAGLAYTFVNRKSSASAMNYSRNKLNISLSARY